MKLNKLFPDYVKKFEFDRKRLNLYENNFFNWLFDLLIDSLDFFNRLWSIFNQKEIENDQLQSKLDRKRDPQLKIVVGIGIAIVIVIQICWNLNSNSRRFDSEPLIALAYPNRLSLISFHLGFTPFCQLVCPCLV